MTISEGLLRDLEANKATGILRKYGKDYYIPVYGDPTDIINNLNVTPFHEDEFLLIEEAIHLISILRGERILLDDLRDTTNNFI